MTALPILNRAQWPSAAATYCRSLEAEIARLENRMRDLEQVLGLNLAAPAEFRLSRGQAVLFNILLRREAVTREALHLALCARSQNDGPGIGIVATIIYQLRRKLRPHGVKIDNIHGQGYRMTPESKTKVAAIMTKVVE